MAGMIEEALMVFKSLSGPAPEYLSSIFMGRSDTIPYTFLDSVNKFNYSTTGTHLKNYLRKSFHYSGAVLWTSNFKAS